MRILHSGPVRSLITLVIAGCLQGTTNPITGISNDSTLSVASRRTRSLSFFTQPNTTNVGQVISPAVQVAALDSTGAADTTFTGVVTVALASNPSGGVLGTTTSVRAARGIASFGALTVDRIGTYTLRATSPGLVPATSQVFTITTPTTR